MKACYGWIIFLSSLLIASSFFMAETWNRIPGFIALLVGGCTLCGTLVIYVWRELD